MRRFFLLLFCLISLVGCGQAQSTVGQPPRPTATIAPFFSGGERPIPPISVPTARPRPTSELGLGSDNASTSDQRDPLNNLIVEVTIFDEGLAQGWSSSESFGQIIDLESSRFASSGFTSLEAIPRVGFGSLALTVSEENRRLFPRSEIVGLRFDVSGGAGILTPADLIVKVLGSNRYPYFVANDNSVPRPPFLASDKPIFDEVGLGLLGMQRDLQPGEWAEIELWLNDYDQVDYRYITGLVFFNNQYFLRPFYVDNVRLLVLRS